VDKNNSDMEKLSKEARSAVEKAADMDSLEKLRVEYLGRKGKITQILRSLSSQPIEQRRDSGRQANELKDELSALLDAKAAVLKREELKGRMEKDRIDRTLPPLTIDYAHSHPLIQVLNEIVDIFSSLGFQIATGPEIETDYFNFEALNFPPNHPARDAQDTFYIAPSGANGAKNQEDPGQLLLRTHTSPVQIHVMKQYQPPLRVVIPGRVYRHEAVDVTHSIMFHQVEGLAVDTSITFADLKGTLTLFAKRMFGKEIGVRFRPSFFPFTEPSAELDIQCIICSGKGCRVCKNSGWLEMLGCGMVHPRVFDAVGYDREKYVGFAFGLGVERFAMLKYQIDDMRLFFENDLRFLKQF
jgi:phenylalanyl-tRNA synthetase alpha chain